MTLSILIKAHYNNTYKVFAYYDQTYNTNRYDITYNGITYNWFYKQMTLLVIVKVNKKLLVE